MSPAFFYLPPRITIPVSSSANTAAPARSYAGPTVLFFLLATFAILAPAAACYAQTKAIINKRTKSFTIRANMREDHKIFGYSAANVKSAKLILFSIFTSDVKDNPYRCPLGAYYETSGLPNNAHIVFVSEGPGFMKLTFINAENKAQPFYIQRKFVEFN